MSLLLLGVHRYIATGGETYHILLETGDDLLLETGDYILLESSP
jgi:hypothetical protein